MGEKMAGNGSSIVRNIIVEQTFDNAMGIDFTLPFGAATVDQSQAYMVVHNTTVRINRRAPFLLPYDQGAAFEFVFPAKDPIVEGVGFAATRDLISFFKHDTSTQNILEEEA